MYCVDRVTYLPIFLEMLIITVEYETNTPMYVC